MPPIERDAALWDAERILRHQHSSSSDHGRALVPMWDSSDPERAPPPLPLNPQSPGVATSRAGTSSAIQSAHAAMAEKARESALVHNVLTKRIGDGSPERRPRTRSPSTHSRSDSVNGVHPATHRRMQSLQPTSVRDRSLMLEAGARLDSSSPVPVPAPLSPSREKQQQQQRPSTPPISSPDPFPTIEQPQQMVLHQSGPGPSLTPIVRPIVLRPHQQSILGENTPPKSATMLALHDMAAAGRQRDATPQPTVPTQTCQLQPQPQPQPQQRSLQPEKIAPLSNVTNGAAKLNSNGDGNTASKLSSANNMAMVRPPTQAVDNKAFDNLTKQIYSLTNIASTLQKDLSLLSRRSRDNATDLMSLKEATNARDEDIRKSLRELMTNTSDIASTRSRDSYGGPLLIDNKSLGHTTSPLSKTSRPFSLPRIPSPNSFAASMASLDRDTMSTPSLYGGADAPHTLALLERIVRDMGTKEGQTQLLGRLAEAIDKLSGMASAAKLEELLQFVKSHQPQATENTIATRSVAGDGIGGGGSMGRSRSFSFGEEGPSEREIDHNHKSPMTVRAERLLHSTDLRHSSAPTSGAASEIVNEDFLKIIKTVKDSVAQGGGLTAEVKALVRELRGEVLGMGREIGRRLDEVETRVKEEGKPDDDLQIEIAKVVEEGLSEMKQHMNNLIREHRRQSTASVAAAATAAAEAVPMIDYQEIYSSLRAALKDSSANKPREISREDILQAVQEAWETYKPEIEVQQIGLERDEVLACLQEGLRDYAPRNDQPNGATRDEVFTAVIEGLKHFVPPQMPATGMSRDEVLSAVRECLEEFEFPVAPSAMGAEITKEDMVDAVKQGLNNFDFPQPATDRDLVLHGESPVGSDEIVSRLQEIMQFMREEFQAVSNEAKQNVAASGRDTEQVLDATRDGLETLRADLEAYVDKVAATVSHVDVTDGFETLRADLEAHVDRVAATVSHVDFSDGLETLRADMEAYVDKMAAAVTRDDFSDGLIRTLDVFRDEIADMVAKANDAPREVLKEEIEALRETVNSSMVPSIPSVAQNPAAANSKEILEALQEGVSLLRGEISNRHITSTAKVLDTLQEGMAELRICIEKLGNKPTDLTANDEILDALKSGLNGVRSDIGGLREQNTVATLDPSTAMVPADMLRRDDIENLESLISQLRDKVDVADVTQVQLKETTEREINTDPEDAPSEASASSSPTAEAWQEKLSAMERVLHMIHESVTGLASRESAPRDAPPAAPQEPRESQEPREPREPRESTEAASREDVEAIETILRNTKARLDDLIDGEQSVRKDHIDSIEALILETKLSLETLQTQMDGLSSREDVNMVESLVAQVSRGFDEMKERHEKQLEDPDKVTKADVDAIALACLQVKSEVERLSEDNSGLPTKDDLLNLTDIVREVKSHLEAESDTSVKAFEDRQAEIAGVGEQVGDVKAFLEELNEMVKTRLEDGFLGIDSVGKVLDALSDTIGQNSSDLRDLYDTMRTEFEESRASAEDSKLTSDERFQHATDMLEATFDERITELISKFDGFQEAQEERALVNLGRDEGMEEAVTQTKNVAEELKLLIDTLGSAVTDSLEKMEEASKTVFTRVDEMVGRAEEQHIDGKAEHQQTREDVKQAIDAIQDVQSQVVEHQPKILETIKDVLLVVSEHYEHSKTSTTTIQETIVENKPEIPPVEKYDDTTAQEKLDRLVVETDRTTVALAKLDKMDALVDHALTVDQALTKLDRLVEHSEDTDKALVRLEELDKLEKLDYLVAQADSNSQSLADLEKLAKLDQIIELSHVAGRAFDAQHGKIDRLLDHTSTTNETLVRLDQLDQLDEIAGHTRATNEACARLDKLDQLEEIAGHTRATNEALGRLDQLDQLEEIVGHARATNEACARLDKLDQLEEIAGNTRAANEALGRLDQLDEITGHTRATNEACARLDKLDQLDEIADHTRATNEACARLDQLNQLEEIADHTRATNEACARLDQLDQLEEIAGNTRATNEACARLNKLDQLDEIAGHSRAATVAFSRLDKLDQLEEIVDRTRSTDEALSQLENLDKVHQKVVQMAAELSDYMTTQRKRIADEHEDHEKTLQETMFALERRQAEKEQAEASVSALREEEQRLKESVASLRAEQESMARNKTRLVADVSSLETALRLRREELHEMEARAEGLERRILDGVMDHSRVLLMAKANKNGRDAMSRKRVVPPKKEAGIAAAGTSPTRAAPAAASSKPRAAFNMAMSAKRNPLPAKSPGGMSANGSAAGSRRILSLSQINKNTPGGSMTRSHSVRANVAGIRKSSWGGRLATTKGGSGYGSGPEADKENAPLKESDEEDQERTPEPEDAVMSSSLVPYRRADRDCDDFGSCAGDGEDGEDGDDRRSEAGTMKGSAVGTPRGAANDDEAQSDDAGDDDSGEDDDDVMSEWTSSQVSAAPSAVGPTEMVLYGEER